MLNSIMLGDTIGDLVEDIFYINIIKGRMNYNKEQHSMKVT